MDIQSIRAGKKVNFGMKCLRLLLILMNVVYLIISFLMISGGTTFKVIFGENSSLFWYDDTIKTLPSLWIATGCFLMVFSIFGIAAAVKESAVMTNLYGILLSLVFILQMAAAIMGFTLMTRANGLISNSIEHMMGSYNYNYDYKNTLDWIQRSFLCCGNHGPSDWQEYGPYEYLNSRTSPYNWWTVTNDYWYTSSTAQPTNYVYWNTPEVPADGDYDDALKTDMARVDTTTTTLATTQAPRLDKTPESCCTRYSSTYDNYTCEYHFDRGCHSILLPIVSDSIMMIGTSALVIGVVEIFGIVCAFVLSRAIRRAKTQRDMQKWTIHQSMGFDRPAYIDDVSAQDNQTGDVKHV